MLPDHERPVHQELIDDVSWIDEFGEEVDGMESARSLHRVSGCLRSNQRARSEPFVSRRRQVIGILSLMSCMSPR